MDTVTIDYLCEKLGTTAEEFVPRMAQYHITMNVVAIVLMSIVSIVLLCLWTFIEDETVKDIVWITAWVCIPVCIIFIVMCVVNIAGWQMQPEVKALETLFGNN